MGESDTTKLYGELQQVNVKIDNLTDLFNRAAYGDGFIRCAKQNNRLDNIEASVGLCHARVTGVKKWLLAGLVAVLGALAGFVWDRLKFLP